MRKTMLASAMTILAVSILILFSGCYNDKAETMSYDEYFAETRELTVSTLNEEDLNSLKTELSLESVLEENLLVYEDIVFYKDGDSIYRYYLLTETLDLMIEKENVLSWEPLTNNTLSFTVASDDYLEAVEVNGEEGYITDRESVYYDWFWGKYENHPIYEYYDNEFFYGYIVENYTLEQLFEFCGIETETSYVYDFTSKEIYSIEKEPMSYEEYFSKERALLRSDLSEDELILLKSGLLTELGFSDYEAYQGFFVTDEVIFFRIKNSIENSIYRYYIPTKTLDLLFTNDEMNYWYRVSNLTFLWSKDNPDYIKCVEKNGGTDTPEDPKAFYEWFLEEFKDHVHIERYKSEAVQSLFYNEYANEFREFLVQVALIPMYLTYFYDTTTGLSTETFPLKYIRQK